jgi:hypothetical protein
MTINIGDAIDNRTICDLFRVANMGGIRVCTARNLIVLISNNTGPVYRNEWKDGTLHFVGMGSIGPQKLDRQNKTLANANRSGTTLYLFEVFEKSRYIYAGEVELADEPYQSDQIDARADRRFVWIFPLRRKPVKKSADAAVDEPREPVAMNHLPYGAYAVVGSELRDDQLELVNKLLDQLKEAGVPVFDGRDVDRQRYDRAMGRWHEDVLDQARSIVRELIAKKERAAKARYGSVGVIDDELKINSGSDEQDLREALKFLDREDIRETEAVFEEARQRVPMPEIPKSLLLDIIVDSTDDIVRPKDKKQLINRSKFKDFT